MSGAQIASEVAAALREAGTDTGDGPLIATLQPAQTGGNPWDVPGATPDPVEIVVIQDQFRRDEIDEARIRSGDKKLLAEANGTVPQVGDGLTIGGVAHRLEGVWPLAPAGIAVMFTLQAREV